VWSLRENQSACQQAKPRPKANQGFQRLSNKALVITLTELSAMAAPATTGLK
jgi:hypothetical protein